MAVNDQLIQNDPFANLLGGVAQSDVQSPTAPGSDPQSGLLDQTAANARVLTKQYPDLAQGTPGAVLGLAKLGAQDQSVNIAQYANLLAGTQQAYAMLQSMQSREPQDQLNTWSRMPAAQQAMLHAVGYKAPEGQADTSKPEHHGLLGDIGHFLGRVGHDIINPVKVAGEEALKGVGYVFGAGLREVDRGINTLAFYLNKDNTDFKDANGNLVPIKTLGDAWGAANGKNHIFMNPEALNPEGFTADQQKLAMMYVGNDGNLQKILQDNPNIDRNLLAQTIDDPNFSKYAQELNDSKVSVGRIFARNILGIAPGSGGFKWASGAMDAVTTFLDPILFGGKLAKAVGAGATALDASEGLVKGFDTLVEASNYGGGMVRRAMDRLGEFGSEGGYDVARMKAEFPALEPLAPMFRAANPMTGPAASQVFREVLSTAADPAGNAGRGLTDLLTHAPGLGPLEQFTKPILVTVGDKAQDLFSKMQSVPVLRPVGTFLRRFSNLTLKNDFEANGLPDPNVTSFGLPSDPNFISHVQQYGSYGLKNQEIKTWIPKLMDAMHASPDAFYDQWKLFGQDVAQGMARATGADPEVMNHIISTMNDQIEKLKSGIAGTNFGAELATEVASRRIPVLSYPDLLDAVRSSKVVKGVVEQKAGAVQAFTRFLDQAVVKAWKPLTLMRLAFPIRVAAEENVREMLHNGVLGHIEEHFAKQATNHVFKADRANDILKGVDAGTLAKAKASIVSTWHQAWAPVDKKLAGGQLAMDVAHDNLAKHGTGQVSPAVSGRESTRQELGGLGDPVAPRFDLPPGMAKWATDERYVKIYREANTLLGPDSAENFVADAFRQHGTAIDEGAVIEDMKTRWNDNPRAFRVYDKNWTTGGSRLTAKPLEDTAPPNAVPSAARKANQGEHSILNGDLTTNPIDPANAVSLIKSPPVSRYGSDLSYQIHEFRNQYQSLFKKYPDLRVGVHPTGDGQVYFGIDVLYSGAADRKAAQELVDAGTGKLSKPSDFAPFLKKRTVMKDMKLTLDTPYTISGAETPKGATYQREGVGTAAQKGFTRSKVNTTGSLYDTRSDPLGFRKNAKGFQGDTQDYAGEAGNTQHITRTQNGTMPLEDVSPLNGASGEVRGEHRNMTGAQWDAFKEDIRKNGIREPIFITHDPGAAPVISEGNHRLDAAKELGLKRVPVEIRHYGHAETEGGFGVNGLKEPGKISEAEIKKAGFSGTTNGAQVKLFGSHPVVNESRLRASWDDAQTNMAAATVRRYKNLLVSKDGEMHAGLLDGHAQGPEGLMWLRKNLNPDDMSGVWRNSFDTAPHMGAAGKLEAATFDRIGQAIDYMSRSPIYGAEKLKAYKSLQPWVKEYMKSGMTEDAAKQWALDRSDEMATKAMSQWIHDPGIRSQFAKTHAALFPFWFAQEQFVKRWGKLFFSDPAAFRKLQLVHQGLIHSGWVQQEMDDTGQPTGNETFNFPLSGYLAHSFQSIVGKIPYLKGAAIAAPVLFQGQVKYLLPGGGGFDNVFPSLGPLGQFSLDGAKKLAGDTNAKAPWQDLVPESVMKGFKAFGSNEKNSSYYANAMLAATRHLEAQGKIHQNMTPQQLSELQDQVQEYARSILIMQNVLGFISPGSPVPKFSNDLSPEYLKLLQITDDPNKAQEIFLKNHPYDASSMIFKTHANISGVKMPLNQQTTQFLEGDAPSVKTYGDASYFFMPLLDNGAYDPKAYQLAMRMNLRYQRSVVSNVAAGDLSGMLEQMQVAQASKKYYDTKSVFDQAEAMATKAGNTKAKDAIQQAWTQGLGGWEGSQNYFLENPVFALSVQQGSARQFTRDTTLAAVETALSDPQSFQGTPEPTKKAMADLIGVYREYQGIDAQLAGNRSSGATEARRRLGVALNQYAQKIADPNAKEMYNALILPGLSSALAKAGILVSE